MAETDTAVPAEGKYLLLPTPSYVKMSWNDPFTLICFVIFQLVVTVFLYVPIPLLHGLQEQVVASYLFSLVVVQFISPLFSAPIFILPVVMLSFIVGLVFTQNDKFYNLFGAIGASYVLVYLVILLCGIQTNIFIPAILFGLSFVGFVLFKKANREYHYGLLIGIFTGMTANILLSNITPIDMMIGAHSASKMRLLQAIFTICMFLLFGGIGLAWTVYRDTLKEKYKAYREKGASEGNKEESK